VGAIDVAGAVSEGELFSETGVSVADSSFVLFAATTAEHAVARTAAIIIDSINVIFFICFCLSYFDA
jgi:hypothetical protein